MVPMQPIESQNSLRDDVLEELRRQILQGERAPESALRERTVADELGVSRVPVREAFRQLESEGLLESIPRRGVRVAALTDHDADTIHEIRVALELLAVRLTTQRADQSVRRQLGDVLETGQQAEDTADERTLRSLNREFHDLVARGSGSHVLASMLRSARNHSQRLVSGRESLGVIRSWHDHRAIVEAILHSDAETAERIMHDHLLAHHEARRAHS